MKSFWSELSKPIVGLSPMDGITDAPFRYMVAKYGNPSVMYTEFVSVDAMHHVKRGGVERVMQPLIYDQIERPIIAQVFGKDPRFFYDAAVAVSELGFDGIDINMGCPAKKVEQNGSGAGLIRNPELAQEIVLETKQGVEDWYNERVTLEECGLSKYVKSWVDKRRCRGERRLLPVSVKTRIGVEYEEVNSWISTLVKAEPAVIAVHGRTLKQMYQGRADWEAIQRAAKIAITKGITVLGNGDIDDLEGVKAKCDKYGVDGVLIGRGCFGNPGVFSGIKPDERLRKAWMVEHASKYEEIFGMDQKSFFPMRKHLAWYAKGFPSASELRAELMKCYSAGDVKKVIARV